MFFYKGEQVSMSEEQEVIIFCSGFWKMLGWLIKELACSQGRLCA
jgi:hypothetical protein